MLLLDKTKTYVLIDGHNLGYQALYSSGQANSLSPDYNKVYGQFLARLRSIQGGLWILSPQTIFCFDTHTSPDPRREMYSGYKSNRTHNKNAGEAMRFIIDKLTNDKRIVLIQERVEADDLIASLTRVLGMSIIVSADRDLLQCIKDNVYVYAVRHKDHIFYTQETFIREYGFEPQYLPDYKALRGDSSDNIKGLSGVGDKLAKYLIYKFKSLDGIYEAIANNEHIELSDELYHKLIHSKNELYMYRDICRVKYDVEFEPPIHIIQAQDKVFNKDTF